VPVHASNFEICNVHRCDKISDEKSSLAVSAVENNLIGRLQPLPVPEFAQPHQTRRPLRKPVSNAVTQRSLSFHRGQTKAAGRLKPRCYTSFEAACGEQSATLVQFPSVCDYDVQNRLICRGIVPAAPSHYSGLLRRTLP
jgi:hypothetical protein